jgi:ethanolamine ammonia-lyase small subunit
MEAMLAQLAAATSSSSERYGASLRSTPARIAVICAGALVMTVVLVGLMALGGLLL